jgi:two-component system sensor histidine kinase MprB
VAQVISPGGRVRDRDGGRRGLPVDSRAREIAATGRGSETYETEVDGTNLLVLTEGLGSRGAVQVARPLTEVDDSLNRVLLAVVVIGALGVALAVLLGALIARAALAPIARFTRRTEAIAARPDLSERIDVEGDDELARLARSFNATLGALEGAVESQQRLVADASHELRTPIASLRANFETLRESERLPPADREALRADIIEELDELTALVSDVVELARGARPEESLDDVRLDSLVTDLIERAQRRGDGAPVFETELEPTLVRGAPDRIARAVSNLLDNARRWSPPGGTVEVALAGGTLSVRDHGRGFAEADLPRVFERFYRADEARGMHGSGLGLAIVKQAAETHGGHVEAGNAPGGGALVRVSFGPVLDQTDVQGVPR